MNVRMVVETLHLQVIAGQDKLDQEISGGYAADLLSCVMAGAQTGNLWVTLQTHLNIVAVASLLGLSGIVVAEGAAIPPETTQKANEQGIVLLSSPAPVFETVAQLVGLGIKERGL
jgi:serine kinase of HPr protein (carbohydrate metabolism regulator)